MKRFVQTAVLLCFSIVCLSAQNYTFRINGGIDNATLRQKMEQNISALLTEVSQAGKASRGLSLQQIGMTESARASLDRLWKNFHFVCDYEDNVEKCHTDVNGYEVRFIPITLKPTGSGYQGELEKELTITLTKDGTISGVHMALSNNAFHAIVNKGLDVTDTRRRLEILNFVEAFRSYYDEKDLKSLEQVYSDDALIITGKVIMKRSYQNDSPSLRPEIVYSKKDKVQYLKSIENNFRRNKFIKVTFDSISVVRHPAKPNFYGVTLHQKWKSSSYEDDGYVFLLWEFSDEEDEHPVVHVRTWQPDRIGNRALANQEVFNINDFFIP